MKGLIWIGIGIILAMSVETIHYWHPQRNFNPMDAMFNVTGVVVGAAVFFASQISYPVCRIPLKAMMIGNTPPS